MNLLTKYKKTGAVVMRIFRWDLQLHFFWGFLLTLLGGFWEPLYASGVVVTIVKEFLDLWSKKEWSWGDFFCGMTGSVLGAMFLVAVCCEENLFA